MSNAASELSKSKTIERFERQETQRAKAGYSNTKEFAAVINDRIAVGLAEYIQAQQTDLDRYQLRLVNPKNLAVAGLSSLLNSMCAEKKEPDLRIDIGLSLLAERYAAGLTPRQRGLIQQAGRGAERRRAKIKSLSEAGTGWVKVKLPSPTAARLAKAKELGYNSKEWTNEQKVKVGNWFLNCCLSALPDVFEKDGAGGIAVLESARNTIDVIRKRLMFADPVIVPCTDIPKPWTGLRKGGYWDARSPLTVNFVRTYHQETKDEITRAFHDGSMKQHVDGVNALQSVPLRINEQVLEAVKLHARHLMPKLNSALIAEDIATAERFKGGPFFTPINCDFRGRLNGVPHFNYQRDDHVRGLLLFNRGLPSGSDPHNVGSQQNRPYLLEHLANTCGFKNAAKKSLLAKQKWAFDNIELFENTANGSSNAWQKADKPFAFMAACIEFVGVIKQPGYLTRLPVAFDATCSGLQHICAMTRDESGASLVNLSAKRINKAPRDIYGLIANKVAAVVKTRGYSDLMGIEIDRKLVKLPVMTYGYGVTTRTMAKQIGDELEKRPGQKLPWKALTMLAELITQAIEDTFPGAAEVRNFLRGCVQTLVKDGHTLRWVTPTGFPWANRYHKPKVERIRLNLAGRDHRLTVAGGHDPQVWGLKACNAVAPNLVHALDAAHLLRTVNACVSEGIRDILAVHDSFACHASQAPRLNEILREQFVQMYAECDPLSEVHAAMLAQVGSKVPACLPRIPDRGSFDIRQTLQANYAFG